MTAPIGPGTAGDAAAHARARAMASLLAAGADHDPAVRDGSAPAAPMPGTPAAVAAVHAFIDATRLDALLRLLHPGTPPEEVLAARLGLPVTAIRAAAVGGAPLPPGPGAADVGHGAPGAVVDGAARDRPEATGAPATARGPAGRTPTPPSPGAPSPGAPSPGAPSTDATPVAPSHRPGIGVLGSSVAPGTVLVPVRVLAVDHRDTAAKAFAVVAPPDAGGPTGAAPGGVDSPGPGAVHGPVVGAAAAGAGAAARTGAAAGAGTAAGAVSSGPPGGGQEDGPRPSADAQPTVPLARVVVLAEDWRLLTGDRRAARTVADAVQRALDEAFAPAASPLRATATPVGAELVAVHLTPLRPDLPVRVASLLDNAGFALFAQPGAWRPGDPGATAPVPGGTDPSAAALAGVAAVGATGAGLGARPPGAVDSGARWVVPVVVAVVAAALAGTVLGGVGPAVLVVAAVAAGVAAMVGRTGGR